MSETALEVPGGRGGNIRLTVGAGAHFAGVRHPDGDIIIESPSGGELARIYPDGRVEVYGDVDNAARVFWAAVETVIRYVQGDPDIKAFREEEDGMRIVKEDLL